MTFDYNNNNINIKNNNNNKIKIKINKERQREKKKENGKQRDANHCNKFSRFLYSSLPIYTIISFKGIVRILKDPYRIESILFFYYYLRSIRDVFADFQTCEDLG